VHSNDLYLLSFGPTTLPFDSVVSGQIGFAIGGGDGTFNVAQFSLDGAPEAIAAAMKSAVARGTRDQSRTRSYKL
jgi:hypothetical protein